MDFLGFNLKKINNNNPVHILESDADRILDIYFLEM